MPYSSFSVPSIKISRHGEIIDCVSECGRHLGSKRRYYRIYCPASLSHRKPAPLLMVLHGCHQTHEDIQVISDFDRLADRHGFIVVYPFVTRYSDMRNRNCWGWWRPEHIRPGGGEVADLALIVAEVQAQFSVNSKQIHIAGLSSGGAMAAAALTVHSKIFASGAVVAGVAYGEGLRALAQFGLHRYRQVNHLVHMMERARRGCQRRVPLMLVHSRDDEVVPMQAALNHRDAWLASHGRGARVLRVDLRRTGSVELHHTIYGSWWGGKVLETLFLQGPGHAWIGGQPGAFSHPDGPSLAHHIWRFCRQTTMA